MSKALSRGEDSLAGILDFDIIAMDDITLGGKECFFIK